MKHGNAWAIGLLALTLTACGGSSHNGGGTASTSTTTTGPGLTSAYRIESVLANTSLDPNYIYEDPLDIQVLDSVQFQLVNYPDGTASSRTVVPTVGTTAGTSVTFTTNDSLNTAGILTSAGVFTASTTDSGATQYIVTATYAGQIYSSYYLTNPRLNSARVRGRVLSGNTGVYNAQVIFYGARNGEDGARQIVVATARTGPDGTFRATVPEITSVSSGSVLPVTISVRQPTGFGSTFTYSADTTSNVYTTVVDNGPSIDLSSDVYLPGDLVLASG